MKLLACLSYYKQRGAALARHLLPTHCVPLPTSEPSSWDWGKLRSRAAEFISLSVFPRTKQLCREATVAWVGDGAEETEEVAGGRCRAGSGAGGHGTRGTSIRRLLVGSDSG